MKRNVVDDMGDEYFIDSYRSGLYMHNGIPYRFEGFKKPDGTIGTRRENNTGGYTKADFHYDIEELNEWLQRQVKYLQELEREEPPQYHTYEDDDGEEVDSDDETEEWEEWSEQHAAQITRVRQAKELKARWESEDSEENQGNEYFLYFKSLSHANPEPLELPVKTFTSLAGFDLPTGFVNALNGVWTLNHTRCYRVRELTDADDLTGVFTTPYPTLKEALEMMARNNNLKEIAISKSTKVSVDDCMDLLENEQHVPYKRWVITNISNDVLARWDSKQRTLWAKNKNILSILSKKG